MVTRKSVTGILVFLNGSLVRSYCKKQNTVKASSYGAELMAGRIATEVSVEYRYYYRMLGIPIIGPVRLLETTKE